MPPRDNPIHTPISLALLGSGTCSKHLNRDSAASISTHSHLSFPCLLRYRPFSPTLQSSCTHTQDDCKVAPGTFMLTFKNPPLALARSHASITTTLHRIGWLVSGNCIRERSGAKLSCRLAFSRERIPKSPFIPTVVVILEVMRIPPTQGYGIRPRPELGG